ncbi:MAG: hypothetical protein BRC54_15920 [Cyanobacteria bacterium SW_7_48_12]|nr:MAG: hypothetical protein BRC54_15920 [Cyanobacteria bacterium SW_7_48_12]
MALLDFDSIKSIDDQDGVWGADELSLTVKSSVVELVEEDGSGDYLENDTIGSFNPIFTKSPVELNEADGIYDVAFTVI